MNLRILLVDDHEVVRLGLKALLSRYPQFEVVAEAGDAQEALEKTLYYRARCRGHGRSAAGKKRRRSD